jgi:protein-S-isoprenylcysteine O-methyltransferase Ste14
MDRTIVLKVFAGLFLTPIIFGAPIFLSAWTLDYWQAWLFLIVFTLATTEHSVYLAKNDPALLERRMRVGPAAEKRPAQRIIMYSVIISFAAMLVVSGLDHRFAWSNVPVWVDLIGDLLVLLSYYVFYLVCRENTFASATIEISEGQKVITTGPYASVRHPMYSGALLLTLAIPLALGSCWALLIVLVVTPFLIWRIVDEERLLATSLPGYSEYCDKVKYRLIPGLY